MSIIRRLGKFSITRELIEDETATVALAMCGMIVVHAELLWSTGAIQYTAMSEHFDEVEEGGKVPEYRAIMQQVQIGDGDNVQYKMLIDGWEKVQPNGSQSSATDDGPVEDKPVIHNAAGS